MWLWNWKLSLVGWGSRPDVVDVEPVASPRSVVRLPSYWQLCVCFLFFFLSITRNLKRLSNKTTVLLFHGESLLLKAATSSPPQISDTIPPRRSSGPCQHRIPAQSRRPVVTVVPSLVSLPAVKSNLGSVPVCFLSAGFCRTSGFGTDPTCGRFSGAFQLW